MRCTEIRDPSLRFHSRSPSKRPEDAIEWITSERSEAVYRAIWRDAGGRVPHSIRIPASAQVQDWQSGGGRRLQTTEKFHMENSRIAIGILLRRACEFLASGRTMGDQINGFRWSRGLQFESGAQGLPGTSLLDCRFLRCVASSKALFQEVEPMRPPECPAIAIRLHPHPFRRVILQHRRQGEFRRV